jgi:hypothetical protein
MVVQLLATAYEEETPMILRSAEEWVRLYHKHPGDLVQLIESVQFNAQDTERRNFMPDGYVLISLDAASKIPVDQLSEDDARRISDARVQQKANLWNRQARGLKQ